METTGSKHTGMKTNGEQSMADVGDVGVQRLAKVYAEALINTADRRGQSDEVLEELDSLVRDLFAADPSFEGFLISGAIGREEKAAILKKAFESRASEVFCNFMLVLNEHDRLFLVRPVLAAAREIRDERARRVRVQVRSAAPLVEDQRQRLENQLRGLLEKEPVMDVQVDPDLLGGVVVRVGDMVYDASVRTQLDTLYHQLIERSSHEIQSGRDRFSTATGN